jgi:hypothetical protein
MDDQRDTDGSVTRLGPDSGGRAPGEPAVVYRAWSWTSDEPSGRPAVPFLGLFLVGFGGLLLLQQLLPDAEILSWVALVAGVAALIAGVTGDRGGLIYLGAILVAAGLPSILEAFDLISGDGWSTTFLGVAFVVIGLVRRRGPGLTLTFWLGVILLLIGLPQTLFPGLSGLLFPLLIIGLGAVILVRALSRRPTGS